MRARGCSFPSTTTYPATSQRRELTASGDVPAAGVAGLPTVCGMWSRFGAAIGRQGVVVVDPVPVFEGHVVLDLVA